MQVPDDEEHFGARVGRIEPDHLVSMADIARRAGLTRVAISLREGNACAGIPGSDRPRDVRNPALGLG